MSSEILSTIRSPKLDGASEVFIPRQFTLATFNTPLVDYYSTSKPDMSHKARESKSGARSTTQGSADVSTIGFWVGGAQSFSDAGPAGSPPDASKAAAPPTNADWMAWYEHATTLRPEDIPFIEQDVVSCYFWEKDNYQREKEEIDWSKFTAEQNATLESAEQTHQHYDAALTAGERYKRLDAILKDQEFCFSPEGNPIVRLEAAREYVSTLSEMQDTARRARETARSASPSLQTEENSVKSILHSYMVSVKQKPYQSKYYTRLVGEYLELLPKEGSSPAAQQD